MRRSFLRAALAAATAVLVSLPQAARAASLYLVGAEVYSSTSTGSNANISSGYRYSTNSSDGTSYRRDYTLNGSTQYVALSFPLSAGDNVFTFGTSNGHGSDVAPGPYAGLELFFSATPTSYNPALGTSVSPDLAVFAPTNAGTTFSYLPGSATPADYARPAFSAPYSGATSFTIGTLTATITSFSVNTQPAGTFTIHVTDSAAAVPTPAAALGALPLLGLLAAARRTRRDA